jgi:hypothetical protein
MRAPELASGGFGIRYPESGSLDLPYHGVSVWIKDTDLFFFYVRVHATNGSDHYFTYVPKNGSPYANAIFVFIPVGTQYQDGTWRELNRDLDADL